MECPTKLLKYNPTTNQTVKLNRSYMYNIYIVCTVHVNMYTCISPFASQILLASSMTM